MASADKRAGALLREDRAGATWMRLKAFYEQRLADLRAENDGDADETKTARLRGRIAEVKFLLGLDKDLPQQEPYKD